MVRVIGNALETVNAKRRTWIWYVLSADIKRLLPVDINKTTSLLGVEHLGLVK